MTEEGSHIIYVALTSLNSGSVYEMSYMTLTPSSALQSYLRMVRFLTSIVLSYLYLLCNIILSLRIKKNLALQYVFVFLKVRQYKNLIFHGPSHCGKSYIASKLAMSLHAIHAEEGFDSEITKVVLDATSSKDNLMNVLLSKNGLIEERKDNETALERR